MEPEIKQKSSTIPHLDTTYGVTVDNGIIKQKELHKKNKDWFIFAIGIIGIGVIMDIVVTITNNSLIVVTESYMDYIYSAIVTISVLSFTLIALLAGTLSTRYYGYELKDMLGFKNSSINLKRFISASLIYIMLATIALALSFIINSVNTLTFLLFSMVYIVLHTGLKIYELMTDEKCCVNILKNYYETIQVNKINYDLFKFHLNKLSIALEIAINAQSKEDKDKILGMACTLCAFMKNMGNDKEYYGYFNYLNSVIKKYVVDLSLHFGYNEMVRDIVNLYEVVSDNQFVRNDFLILPIKEMQFYDDRTLQNLNYLVEIMDSDLLDEYKEHKIKDEEIQRILYNYISALLKNQICSTKCKNKMLTSYIYKLSMFNWNSKDQLLQLEQIVLLNILKNYIIQNEDLDERKFIFEELVKNTFMNNVHNNSNTYYNYLSVVFQVFYAYIMLEVETFKQDYRVDIKRLFKSDITTSNIMRLNIGMLIKMNIEGVLCAIARRIEKDDEFTNTFEYFPPYTMAKLVVWTKEFNIRFMFLVFMLYHDEVGIYSLFGRFFDWKEMTNATKLKILNEIMNFFDYDAGVLKKDIINEIGKLAELMQCSFAVNEINQIKLFEHISEEHGKLYLENINEIEIPELDMADIKQRLNELMENENVFGWSTVDYDHFSVRYSTPDCICRKEYKNNRSAARNIQTACLSAINNYILSSTNELELTFDEQGIKKMLEFLNKLKYDSKNYIFTNDWAFLKELRDSSEFQEVIYKDNFIQSVDTNKINEFIYFNKDNFRFNIKILYYKCLDLTDEECVDYIENSKAYNGLYNIDGALMAKDKAINTVQRLFYREKIALKLMVSFVRNDVTHIKFKY